jgi:hypothetical protein
MRRVLIFLAFVLACAPAAADDVLTISGIHVDASAQSASTAQLAAMAQGRPKAWSVLYKRLAKQQEWSKEPRLDDTALQRIIRTFTVKNEKRSTTRYVADVTYTFSPEGVSKVLSGVGINFAQTQPKRILLVPFAPNYTHTSMWTAAFSGTRYAASAVPFSLPGSESLDVSFDAANWLDVEPFAARVRASEAVLVQAAPNGKTMTITLKRIGAGELPYKTSFEVPMLPGGAAATYSSAADATVKAVEDMWKNHVGEFSPVGRLTADVHIASLAQWTSLQTQMQTVPNVSSVSVQAMDIGEARISIAYLGSTDQLKDAMAQQGLTLVKSGGEWSLSAGTP